ncbi:hypothetical protein NC651_010145 [Populus alba x Populus x berolinensis]|nr:hypothetical protein NC651_010145 [Populus alba x Populus x berolinensis]
MAADSHIYGLGEDMKINVDCSSLGNPSRIRVGGLIRSSAGNFLVGFIAFAGVACNLLLELLVIAKGQKLAWNHGYREIICHSDSKNAFILLSANQVGFHNRLIIHPSQTHTISLPAILKQSKHSSSTAPLPLSNPQLCFSPFSLQATAATFSSPPVVSITIGQQTELIIAAAELLPHRLNHPASPPFSYQQQPHRFTAAICTLLRPTAGHLKRRRRRFKQMKDLH